MLRSISIITSIAAATGLVVAVGVSGVGACGGSNSGGPGGDDGGGGAGGGGGGELDGCANDLQCRVMHCGGGGHTTLSGTVHDPAGKNPLYDVIVYVPGGPVMPFPKGVSCDHCGQVIGNPIASALTDAAGHFTLTDVPSGANVPVVVQIGKWRRQAMIANVNSCTDNPIPDDLVRLPKNQMEGDIPQIGLVTGGCDPLECLLRRIGIDDSEFTDDQGPGRVHIFTGVGGAYTANSHNAEQLYGNGTDIPGDQALQPYDMVALSCECDTHPENKPMPSLQAMFDWVGKGGRMFASHYQYYWLESGPQPFPTTATWNHVTMGLPQMVSGTVDQSFPKGMAFADWLVNVGASQTKGVLPIVQPRHDATAVNTMTSQQWVYENQMLNAIEYYSFQAPVGQPTDKQCGRVVFSDLHLEALSGVQGLQFPSECQNLPMDLSPQEKALEFLLFELESCIQDDKMPPVPPR